MSVDRSFLTLGLDIAEQALLDVIDEKLGLANMPDAADYVLPTRWQVAAVLGAARRDENTDVAASVDAALLRALGSRVEVGIELGAGALPDIEARGAALLRLRQPIQRGLAEAYLQIPLGATMSVGDDSALRLRTGAWLGFKARLTPGTYVFAELGADLLHPTDDTTPKATQGLLRLGYGWAQ